MVKVHAVVEESHGIILTCLICCCILSVRLQWSMKTLKRICSACLMGKLTLSMLLSLFSSVLYPVLFTFDEKLHVFLKCLVLFLVARIFCCCFRVSQFVLLVNYSLTCILVSVWSVLGLLTKYPTNFLVMTKRLLLVWIVVNFLACQLVNQTLVGQS
jgi:hypothetical protein